MREINKKGEWRSEVLYIIIAIIGLYIIIRVLGALYDVHVDQEARAARDRLGVLVEKIEIMDIGEGKVTLQGIGGKKDIPTWYLVGWNKKEGETEGKPPRCFAHSCLCICKIKGSVSEKKDFYLSCQEEGSCVNVDYQNLKTGGYVAGMLRGEFVVPVYKEYIPIHQNLNELYVKKSEDSVEIMGANRVEVSDVLE